LRNFGFTLIELMIVVVILGVMAAIAIPVFIRYVRSSKTLEAKQNLAYLYRESTTYFTAAPEKAGQGMGALDIRAQFPDTQALTPAAPGRGSKTSGGDWTTPTWLTLKFAISDPHYYAYRYESNGIQGTSAGFSAQAWGDLDGDGASSFFERQGLANESLEVVGSKGIYEREPLE
jgi:type IV pilus assembly protein PilA